MLPRLSWCVVLMMYHCRLIWMILMFQGKKGLQLDVQPFLGDSKHQILTIPSGAAPNARWDLRNQQVMCVECRLFIWYPKNTKPRSSFFIVLDFKSIRMKLVPLYFEHDSIKQPINVYRIKIPWFWKPVSTPDPQFITCDLCLMHGDSQVLYIGIENRWAFLWSFDIGIANELGNDGNFMLNMKR